MNVGRYLREETVELDLAIERPWLDHADDYSPERLRLHEKEAVVEGLAELFTRSGEVRNPSKFRREFLARERKASTAVGEGLALPHVRSLQPRSLVMIFARSRGGVEFLAPDGAPVHLFLGLTTPKYDDAAYLRFYKFIARAFTEEPWLPGALMEAERPGEVIRIIKSLRS